MGIGSGIENTNELKVLGFDEAMALPDKDNWKASVDMLKNGVWEVVDHHNIPKGANIIDSMWAMNKKANGEYHAWLAARGLNKPKANLSFIMTSCLHIMVYIILVLMLMGNMITHLVNVNGAFLLGEFMPDEKIYMKIPWRFKKFIHKVDCCS